MTHPEQAAALTGIGMSTIGRRTGIAALDLTVASHGALPAGGRPVIPARLGAPDRSDGQIASCCGPVDAIVAADAPMLMLAAAVAARLGLPHNPPSAVLAAADKARQRELWGAAGVAQPRYVIVSADTPAAAVGQAAAALANAAITAA